MALSDSLASDGVVQLSRGRRPGFWRAADTPRRYRRSRYTSARRATHRASHIRIKRIIDLAGASLALLMLAPLLIGIAVAVKLTSSGPVLFSQRRYGYHNHRFRIYKFRTMYIHLGDATGTRQTTDGDPRVTPLGRILRTTSLDELPQLFNVVLGDMSLVGPRPHVPGMLAASLPYEDLIPYYFQRHMVRPGITGLAQVNGCRGSTKQSSAAIDRIDYDLEYIEKWSLWLDMKIILLTVNREFLCGNGN